MKKALKTIGIILVAIIGIASAALIIEEVRTKHTQDVSCGYAVIEMFSTWNDGNVTEESLYEHYGKPVPFEWVALYGDEWTLHYS